jgi:hypothetical protein
MWGVLRWREDFFPQNRTATAELCGEFSALRLPPQPHHRRFRRCFARQRRHLNPLTEDKAAWSAFCSRHEKLSEQLGGIVPSVPVHAVNGEQKQHGQNTERDDALRSDYSKSESHYECSG